MMNGWITVIAGFVVGWIYTQLLQRKTTGLTVNLLLGMTGGLMGGFASSSFGGNPTIVADIGFSILGALVILVAFTFVVRSMKMRT